MILRVLLCLIALLATSAPAFAQSTPYRGAPSDNASKKLVVDSTAPILVKCRTSLDSACFRVYFEIRPSDPEGNIAVARISGRDGDYETRAFAGTGASCTGNDVGGLPTVNRYTSGDIEFGEPPFVVTDSKPGVYMLQFSCDGKLLPGDEVTVQITFAADPTGRGPVYVRYVFPRLALQAPPR